MELAAFCSGRSIKSFCGVRKFLLGNSPALGPSKVNKHDRRAGAGSMTDVALTAQDFAPKRAPAHEKDRSSQNITETGPENVWRHG